MVMKRLILCLSLLAVGGLSAADAQRWRGGGPGPRRYPDQYRAREAAREGAPPLRELQQQWRQRMPGRDYLGSDYDESSGNYRLKFMREGSVSWIDVDGRTGREVGRSPKD